MKNQQDYNQLLKLVKILEAENNFLEFEKAKYFSIIENSPANIVITDLNGNMEYTNSYFTEITGYTIDEAIGQNTSILNSGCQSDEFYKELWETISAGRLWKGEFHNKKKNGQLYWEQANIAPIKNKDGIITNYVAIKFDITLKKEYEQQLIELNATKDKLFSIIAHDLKNPFWAILSLSATLQENIKLDNYADSVQMCNLINISAKNAYNLLENLLQWAQTQTGSLKFEPKEIDLQKIVADTCKVLKGHATNKQILLLNNISDEIMVFADKNMLSTILQNLIGNAIKFTPSGGEVKILSREIDDKIEISVVDNGIGIPESIINNLFKEKHTNSKRGTANEKGTGLGLILCKEFAQKHGSDITVKSKEGEETIFSFRVKQVKKIEYKIQNLK